MFSSDEIKVMEQESTKEMYDALVEMIRHEREKFRLAKTEEERKESEVRFKEYVKMLNDLKSCEDHSYMADKLKLEEDKIKSAAEEAEKTRKHDKKKTIGGWIVSIGTSVYMVMATRHNMIVCEGWDKEHYASTTAEKKALEMCCDVMGAFGKLWSRITSRF